MALQLRSSQAFWILSAVPSHSLTLIFKSSAKCTFIYKDTFQPVLDSQDIFILKTLEILYLGQKWLNTSK